MGLVDRLLVGLLFRLGWAIAGGVVGFCATVVACEVVSKLLRGTSWQRYQPCGPAYGWAIFFFGPPSCALIWFLAPPNDESLTCAALTSVAVAVCTYIASSCASD
mmetsp:Transcript_69478/g.144894  ORF Transcript_69478/g.144894 Transcript_69478/m.144894 type:complete len:105 (+) Transcript_69478:74-388(+)